MTHNLISLVPPSPADTNEACLAVLDHTREIVAGGGVCAIAIVALETDGRVHSNFELGPNTFTLVGALTMLQSRVMEGIETD